MQLDSSKLTLLIDTNVWIDYFLGEEELCKLSTDVLSAAIQAGAELLVSPTSLKDIFYLVPRRLKRIDALEGRQPGSYGSVAKACLDQMLELATPSPIGLFECTLAQSLGKRFADYEDNLIMASAQSAQADYVVTRDRPLIAAYPEVCIHPKRAKELLTA